MVVLHVGTHKTGTTALQHSVNIARADLEGWGICYDPDLGRKQSLARAHHALARMLAEPETDDTRRIISGYRDVVAGELGRGQNVVISAQRFYRMEAEEARGSGHARRRYLDRVAGFFHRHARQVDRLLSSAGRLHPVVVQGAVDHAQSDVLRRLPRLAVAVS